MLMAFLEFVLSFLAVIAFSRGIALLMIKDKLHKTFERSQKGVHGHVIFILILACIVFAVVIIGGIDVIDMLVFLFFGMFFMVAWAIREAHRGTRSLWKAYHQKDAQWCHTLGCLLIAGAMALAILLILQGM